MGDFGFCSARADEPFREFLISSVTFRTLPPFSSNMFLKLGILHPVRVVVKTMPFALYFCKPFWIGFLKQFFALALAKNSAISFCVFVGMIIFPSFFSRCFHACSMPGRKVSLAIYSTVSGDMIIFIPVKTGRWWVLAQAWKPQRWFPGWIYCLIKRQWLQLLY